MPLGQSDVLINTDYLGGAVTRLGATPFLVVQDAGLSDLVRLPCSNPVGSVSGRVLTVSAITTTAAIAAGTAARFELRDAATGTAHLSGTVGTSGAHLVLSSTTIAVDDQIEIASGVINGDTTPLTTPTYP